MLKENRILPDMQLILFKRAYLCYFIALCYVIIALMAAFCLHCHTTTQRRLKRDTTTMNASEHCEQQHCERCSASQGCEKCKGRLFLFTSRDNAIEIGSCRSSCPPNFREFRTNRPNEVTRCIKCSDSNCHDCNGSENYCIQCRPRTFLYDGKCYRRRHCPHGLKADPKTETCAKPKLKRMKCRTSPWEWSNCSCINGKMRYNITRRFIQEPDPGKICRVTKLSRNIKHKKGRRSCRNRSDERTQSPLSRCPRTKPKKYLRRLNKQSDSQSSNSAHSSNGLLIYHSRRVNNNNNINNEDNHRRNSQSILTHSSTT